MQNQQLDLSFTSKIGYQKSKIAFCIPLMQPTTILYIIIGITTISYLFDQFLDYLNLKVQRADIPQDVVDFYDRTKYLKSLDYHRELTRFSFLTSAFSFLLSLLMLVFGGFGWLDQYLSIFTGSDIVRALAFFAVLMIASDLLTLPFQLYSTFVIEEKYGFNKTTVRIFFADKLKGYLLAALIGGPLLALLIYLVLQIGPSFWIWFSLVAGLFVLCMNIFYTTLILPLFNKLTPLPDGELKSAINTFASKVNFPLDNIFVIDGSKRSSKANAFFSGIGKKKKIVLYDTLIQKHTTEELVAVLAHEVGHFKKKHIIWSLVLSIIQIVFTLFILSQMVYNENLSLALGGEKLSVPLNLIAFSILFTPISAITGVLMSMLSRKNEFEADAYAKEMYSGAALMQALKNLSVDSLSNLYPHPWYVFFHYSHPPLLERLTMLSR
jgi:STE24 endopeptidase